MDIFRRREPGPPAEEDRWAHVPAPRVPEDVLQEHKRDLPPHGLARSVWTERDFALMGWHDASVWSFTIQQAEPFVPDSNDQPTHRLLLDLDYITAWVPPQRAETYFTFWVAPCTLVFHGVTEFDIACATGPYGLGPQSISAIHPVRGGWHIDTHDGLDLAVAAAGFRQTFRRAPILQQSQMLSLADRGGYSYDETPAIL